MILHSFCLLFAFVGECASTSDTGLHHGGGVLLVTNASAIYTMDTDHPLVDSFCVGANGRFIAIGRVSSTSKACGPNASVLNANGATILPGLIDSHAHLVDEGRRLAIADLSKTGSAEECVQILLKYVKTHPPRSGSFIEGFGWDQNQWAGAYFPGRRTLDSAFPTTPVYLDRIDGHAAWVNSMALRMAGITSATPDPEGGRIVRDDQGHPTGILLDNARLFVSRMIPKPIEAERRKMIQAALQECASIGLTGLSDMGQDPANVQLYKLMAAEGDLTLRLHVFRLGADEAGMGRASQPTDEKMKDYQDVLTVAGVKFFLDGALGSWGAAMLENYTDHPELSGSLRVTPSFFRKQVQTWAEAGWQVAAHAIGDRANRVALDVYEQVILDLNMSQADHRFRVEHAQIIAASDVPRFAQLKVLPSMQPDHAMFDMDFAVKRVGAKRILGAYAWRSLLNTGIKALPFGSDFPTAGVVNPWWGIYAAVTRQDFHGQPPRGWFPEQRVSVKQALAGYTTDAAYAVHAETTQGSITVGKYADFVLVDRNIFEVPAEQIWQARTLGTFVGGRRVDKVSHSASSSSEQVILL